MQFVIFCPIPLFFVVHDLKPGISLQHWSRISISRLLLYLWIIDLSDEKQTRPAVAFRIRWTRGLDLPRMKSWREICTTGISGLGKCLKAEKVTTTRGYKKLLVRFIGMPCAQWVTPWSRAGICSSGYILEADACVLIFPGMRPFLNKMSLFLKGKISIWHKCELMFDEI